MSSLTALQQALQHEATRQQAVLAALSSAAAHPTAGHPALQAARLQTDPAGLRAYQANAQATAHKVLRHTYPTVAAMLGPDTLDTLARLLWRQHPPASGNLDVWGEALPTLLAAHPDLQAWPWLADAARLDWACHQCERAADAPTDASSLALLREGDPRHLRMHLRPCVRLVSSPWPIVSLWQAHQGDETGHASAAAQALADGGPQTAVVWRQPWRAQVAWLPDHQTAWMQALLRASGAPSLAAMLDKTPPEFDLSAWLGEALSQGWLWQVSQDKP